MEKFLNYYQKEIEYQARTLLQFGEQYPEVAENLELNVLGSDDPAVAKLLESAAFLNAGCQKQIEDLFPDFTACSLDVNYPELLAPFVPVGISKFTLSENESEPFTVPRGFELEATTTKSMGCHFETVYPVDLLPIKITEGISESPVLYEALKPPEDVKNIVRIRFESTNNAPIIDLSGKTVRLHPGGTSPNQASLYVMVFPDCRRLDLM
ncbi:MAG: type VI secretion system baseplate subunit TssF, partial [Proteobacteria bacterium]|nr:type VI secretion system baseplate subunit TssF [Pseudomonadota bacterium]